ncbi:hypothetical protein I547_3635 [Mycobacterium kansasii 824]|uniref:Uncharacterized protein n=1 Tax=Mycobacterium kansasii TaxID=1768 RepID=A0A1V3XMV5_MYCKA|nr:hypothetical protein I547_3635 [Mycobacterium kansasii 824]OOK78873.1 hypothetical protein BZL30_2514 [Mycobacterium kansasii]OOK80553.1 hypothetical protein BZL29_2488 [Mycobacterium kansasii]
MRSGIGPDDHRDKEDTMPQYAALTYTRDIDWSAPSRPPTWPTT